MFPTTSFCPFGGKGKSHPEIQLFEILPAIDLRLVIDQASLFVGPMPGPTRIGRNAFIVRLGRLRQEWAGRQGGQNKREDGFHRVRQVIRRSFVVGIQRVRFFDELRADFASAGQSS